MKGKHLTWNDRLTIEKLIERNFSVIDIANFIGCSKTTIYNELKRARYEHLNSDLTNTNKYCPDIAQKNYEEQMRLKGKKARLKEDSKLKDYIEKKMIKEKYSPKAVLLEIKNKGLDFDIDIKSVNTIYSAITKGYFNHITMDHLPRYGRRKQKKRKVKVQKRACRGLSIEKKNIK